MNTERRRRIIDTRTERERVSEVGPVASTTAASRPHRDVKFRSGTPTDSRRRGNPNRPPRLMLALMAAVALACFGGVIWAFASPHGADATSASNASVTASAPAATAKKKAKKRKASTPAKRTSSTSSSASKRISAAGAKSPTSVKAAKTVAAAPAKRSIAALASGDVVVIDAGHQGQGDSSLEPIGPGASSKKAKVADGASGQFAPHDESQVNLDVALKLQKALVARGVKVIMVRTSQNVNISNSERAAIANKAHAALFVRLHCDGISSSSAHGFSTLIPAKNQWTGPIMSSSAKAGKLVQRDALAATGAADAGVKERSDLSGFNWSKVPTVLVEMGFMSNRAEDRALTTGGYQTKLANGIANGVVDYLKSR